MQGQASTLGVSVSSQQAVSQLRNVDFELLGEFSGSLEDMATVIERNIGILRQTPGNPTPIATLFRAFHNIKGDAALARLVLGVQIAHHIESILMRVREDKLPFTPLLGETILLAVDRLEMAVDAVLGHKITTHLRLQRLLDGLERLAGTPATEMEAAAAQVIEDVSGLRPSHAGAAPAPTAQEPPGPDRDMALFRGLAEQLEQRSPHFAGRTARLLQLAHAMNDSAGRPVDPQQLTVAVYVHDIGMMFLPEPLWLKPGHLSADERAQLRRHPGYAADLLERMPGWEEAARIVRQHHETPDGMGYPAGLKAEAILPGAKILAIVDAFEAVMLKHNHRGPNISVLRGAAEINACENQFAQEWIVPFNQVVRKLI